MRKILLLLIAVGLVTCCAQRPDSKTKGKIEISYNFLTLIEREDYANAKALIVGRFPDSVSLSFHLTNAHLLMRKFGKPSIYDAKVRSEMIGGFNQMTIEYSFDKGKISKENLANAQLLFTFLGKEFGDSIVGFHVVTQYK